MQWRKLGRVFVPDGKQAWARTHALLPTPLLLDGRVRVYFASLDDESFGRPGFVDLDPRDPLRVLDVAPAPVMELGDLGAFDDSGVTPSFAARCANEVRLYYVAWQRAVRVPYMLFTGLADSTDGGLSFKRRASVPVLERTLDEPFSRGALFVTTTSDGFVGWYWSCVQWSVSQGRVHYNNVIRRAVSTDGVSWCAVPGVVLAPRASEGEFSLGRPWVVRVDGRYRMWLTVRSHRRPDFIGLAESEDGVAWVRRDDEVGISRSDQGWDAEMLCYAAVVEVGGRILMFYNGNRHGQTGFGCAELVAS